MTAVLLPIDWLQEQKLCFVKNLFGYDCPGCGLTRAFSYFFKGDFRNSLSMNALAPVLVLWFSIYFVDHLYTWIKGQRPRWFTPQGATVITQLFMVLFVGQWLWKSLPLLNLTGFFGP